MADILTKKQRSYCMSRIHGFDTAPEMLVRKQLHALGLRYRCNVQTLPGRPDIVFTAARLMVFIDGDFWHGYRFPSWKNRLPPYWISKIEKNRARDTRNHRRLRRAGWRLVRIWEHQVVTDLDSCIARILLSLKSETPTTKRQPPSEAVPGGRSKRTVPISLGVETRTRFATMASSRS